ncbi:acetyltransferase [Paenibacillus sp. V4I3]|uniref:acetyltransferase n=1 Tax=Paenibacillus sp. V4I3 TaxID=3042305 RepID=UPI0027D925A9|nr:acetyltransferase [Paenibacillus sp. V4I3]
MNKILLIIGASGHGKVVADIAIKMNNWQSIAFLDDNESIRTCVGLGVIGKSDDAFRFKDDAEFFVAIGNNSTRKKIQEKLETDGASVVSLVHPRAVIGTDVEIGAGTVVMAGVVINSSTKIGKGCIINTCSSLDHDNVMEDYVHISPGVTTAGSVIVGHGSWLGIGSTVINNITICSACIVGAGAVVVKDITESGTFVGVPARRVDS